MARNFSYIVDEVSFRFPRFTPDLKAHLEANLFDGITRDICSRYPYWFLEVPPGYALPSNYPRDLTDLQSRTPVFADWLDRGWLRISPGKSRYLLAAPCDFGEPWETDPAYWTFVQSNRVDFVKEFNFNGTQKGDLEIVSGTRHFTVAQFDQSDSPRLVFWETGNLNGKRVSWIRFSPEPKEYGLYAIQFTLQQPIDYDPGLPSPSMDFTNRFVEEYPEVLITAGLLEAAKWFNEPDSIQLYSGDLYGAPDTGQMTSGQISRQGLIARMKHDTMNRKSQEVYSIPQYLGGRGATGRGGTTTHRRGSALPGTYYQRSY